MTAAASAQAKAALRKIDDILDLSKNKLSQVPVKKRTSSERWMLYFGFPLGMLAHSIGQGIPDFNPKINPRPAYAISELDNRSQVTIFVTGLAPGGALAAILYLVFSGMS